MDQRLRATEGYESAKPTRARRELADGDERAAPDTLWLVSSKAYLNATDVRIDQPSEVAGGVGRSAKRWNRIIAKLRG